MAAEDRSLPSRTRQDSSSRRRGSVRDAFGHSDADYNDGMRDVLFIATVVGFFALAALLVTGCARILARTENGGR